MHFSMLLVLILGFIGFSTAALCDDPRIWNPERCGELVTNGYIHGGWPLLHKSHCRDIPHGVWATNYTVCPGCTCWFTTDEKCEKEDVGIKITAYKTQLEGMLEPNVTWGAKCLKNHVHGRPDFPV